MDIAVVKIGKPQKAKYSNFYQCVKVKDIKTEKMYTLNIGSESSMQFQPCLQIGNVFFGVQTRLDNPAVIDVFKGFDRVKRV